MANIDPRVRYFGVADGQISLVIDDVAPAFVAAVPSTPSAPTVTPVVAGSTTSTYSVILRSSGGDSAASATGTTATGAALGLVNNTVTLGTAVPAKQVAIIQRTAGPGGVGVIGKIGPGGTTLTDIGQTGQTYVAGGGRVADPVGVVYGPAIDVPALQSVRYTDVYRTVDARAEGTPLGSEAIAEAPTLAWTAQDMSYEADALMTGKTLVYSGTSPTRKVSAIRSINDKPPYWKFEAIDTKNGYGSGTGNDYISVFKCVIDGSVPKSFAQDANATFDGGGKSLPRNCDGQYSNTESDETALVLVKGI